jgi:hypothetical protein
MERHQQIAVLIAGIVFSILTLRNGFDASIDEGVLLLISLVPILFYRLIAYLSGFGFPEVFAKDYGSENHSGPYAFFFWVLFLIVCLLLLFS